MTQVAVGLVDRAVPGQPLDEFRGHPSLEGFGHEPHPKSVPLATAGDPARLAVGLQGLVGDNGGKHQPGATSCQHLPQHATRCHRQRDRVSASGLVVGHHHGAGLQVNVLPSLGPGLATSQAGQAEEPVQVGPVGGRRPVGWLASILGHPFRLGDERGHLLVGERVSALPGTSPGHRERGPWVCVQHALDNHPAAEPAARARPVADGLWAQGMTHHHVPKPRDARIRCRVFSGMLQP